MPYDAEGMGDRADASGEGGGRGEVGRAADGVVPRLTWLTMRRIAISASDVRGSVREGRSIRDLVPEGVERYIRENGLYRG